MPSVLTNFYCTSVPKKETKLPFFVLRPLIAMNTRSPNYLVIKSEEDDNIIAEHLCTTTKPPCPSPLLLETFVIINILVNFFLTTAPNDIIAFVMGTFSKICI